MRVFIIAINIFKMNLSKKYTLILYIFLPVLALLLSLIFYKDMEIINVVVIQKDKSFTTSEIINTIESNKNIKVLSIQEESTIEEPLNNKSDAIITIPIDFENTLLSYGNSMIDITCKRNIKEIQLLTQEINFTINKIKYIYNESNSNVEVTANDYKNIVENKINITNEVIKSSGATTLSSALGFIIIFNLMIVTNTLSGIIKDSKNNVWTRILLTSTTTAQYIKGNLLWNTVLSFFQGIIALLFIKFLDIEIGISYINFFTIFSLIILLSLSIGLFIISLCTTEEQIPIVSTLIIFPSSMLSGCLWPIEIMSEPLKRISYIFPQRYIFEFLYELQSGGNINILVLDILLTVLICTIIIYVAFIRIERRQIWR